MKKILSLVFAVIMIFTVAGCGEKGNVETAVEDVMDGIKNSDDDALKQYLGGSETDETVDSAKRNMQKAICATLSYEITDVTVDGDKATAKVSVTFVSITKVMQKNITALISTDKAEIYNSLAEAVKTSEDTKTQEKELSLTKENDKWTVESDGVEALYRAMLTSAT